MSISLLDVMTAPELFGSEFSGASWAAWRTALRAAFGLPMEAAERGTFAACTGREVPPTRPAEELWLIAGRRSGKSRIAALVATYAACFRPYALARGERGVCMVLAADRQQARVVFRYVRGLLDTPLLRPLVERETRESIDLTNGLSIEVHTASYRTVRGYTIVCAVLDEVAFWRSEDAAEPDVEVVNALRPALATTPGALLVGLSSPYAQRGLLYRMHQRYWAKDDPSVLIWRAPTAVMNPTIGRAVIERARAEDPVAAAAEWDAEFRRDIESFLSREAVEACVVAGRRELPPVPDTAYVAFCDPSGGANDSMTLAIAHAEGRGDEARAVLDAVREVRPPFSPEAVVRDFAETVRAYGLARIVSDRYAAGFHAELWEKQGIPHAPAEKPKSDLYRELLPAINSGRAELLDHGRLIGQLCALERRTARGGRDSIDHPPGGRDDVANAVAGAVHLVLGRRPCGWEDLYGDNAQAAPGGADGAGAEVGVGA